MLRVITNAVRWAAPRVRMSTADAPNVKALEPIVKAAAEDGAVLSTDDSQALAGKIIARAYEGRAHLHVLAGVLVEKGREWRYDDALKNVEWFGKLTGPENIQRVNNVLAESIVGFFFSGLASMKTSPKSSRSVLDVVEDARKKARAKVSEPVGEDALETFTS